MTHGEHTTEIVVGGTCEDASEDNPQVSNRSELGTHNGTKDGACTRDIQKLNHKHLPVRKYDVIHPVGLSHSGCHTVIGAEYVCYKTAIEQITQNKSQKAQRKCNHF